MPEALPYPPFELASRVGSLVGHDDPYGFYDLLGRESRASILALLPEDWTWEGKHVLDFGCGAGRTLRHFLHEAETATFWGCDIDRESIEWLEANLAPPLQVFANEETPPLPFAAESLDLVYVVSVFTHLADSWSAWFLELRRVLKPSGLLIATFIGPAAARYITDEPWKEERIGMNVLKAGQRWDLGGPMVLHSPWWIRAHWGRAFDVVDLRLDGFGLPSPEGQGVVLMRKRSVKLTQQDLERPEPGEPREALAALNNVRQLTGELVALRAAHDQLAAALKAESQARDAAGLRERASRQALERIAASHSWRVTRPLRWVARRAVPSRYR